MWNSSHHICPTKFQYTCRGSWIHTGKQDALQQSWTHMFPYAFPQFLLIGKVLRKVQEDKVTMILIPPPASSKGGTINLENEHKESTPIVTLNSVTKKEVRDIPSSMVQQQMETDGISKNAAKPITNARRTGTEFRYKSTLNKWTGWYAQRQINPFRGPMKSVTNFLAEKIEESFEYRT